MDDIEMIREELEKGGWDGETPEGDPFEALDRLEAKLEFRGSYREERDRLKAEVERLRAENNDLHMIAEQATERGMTAEAEVERLRDLLNKDPDVDWQEMAKMLDEKDQEVERLREQLATAAAWVEDRAAEVERLREKAVDLKREVEKLREEA
jgi:chromosome segregation ATPase